MSLEAGGRSAVPANRPSRFPASHFFAGRYRLRSVIGEGANGIVYAAEDEREQRTVALKILHRHLVANRQISARFHREASILRRVRGPHLVELYDFGEDDGLLYSAMELCRGSSLEQTLTRSGPLSIDRCVAIMAQVCSALETAHAARVIHRDLKPANIMVESTSEGEIVKVLDFGMAKVILGQEADNAVLTEQNMVFGTPEYMSPEQARGDEVDARCDVYAAGVILYELLAGRVPFLGSTAIATMTAHLTHEPERPSTRARDRTVPPALEAVVLHALAKSSADRYQSATALRDAILHAHATPDDVIAVRPKVEQAEVLDQFPLPEEPSSPNGVSVSRGGWIVIAVCAAIAGAAVGVWISLRGP